MIDILDKLPCFLSMDDERVGSKDIKDMDDCEIISNLVFCRSSREEARLSFATCSLLHHKKDTYRRATVESTAHAKRST